MSKENIEYQLEQTKVLSIYTVRFYKPFYVLYFENVATSIQHGLKTLSKSFEELLALDINDWHSIQPVWTSEY